jgi:hypothetical protein
MSRTFHGTVEGTGACGINCTVCRLAAEGKCSPCGSGLSSQAQRKLEAQVIILGAPCPILHCAVERRVEYCLRDCLDFPCPHFEDGPYPFSESFCQMQLRRRSEPPPSRH